MIRNGISSSTLEIWWDSVVAKKRETHPGCSAKLHHQLRRRCFQAFVADIRQQRMRQRLRKKKHQGLAVHWPGRVGLGCANTMDCNGLLQWIARNGTPKISQNSPKKGIRRHRTGILSEILTSTACSSLQFTDMTASQDFRGPISPKSLPSSCGNQVTMSNSLKAI